MNRRVQWILLLGLVATLASCRELAIPPAGSYSDVLLVTEAGAGDRWARKIRPYIEVEHDYVTTQETGFTIQNIRAADLGEFPTVKTIVICGVMDSGTDVGLKIIDLIGPGGVQRVAHGKATILKKEDRPAPGQATVIVTAKSADALASVLAKRGGELERILEESCQRRLRRALMAHTSVSLERRLYRKYGFTMKIPYLYRLMSDEANGPTPGVELMRDAPVRDIGIFWSDWDKQPTLYDRDALFAFRAQHVWRRYDHDRMDPNRVRYTLTRFATYPAVRMAGYWYNQNDVAGGYFETYLIWDKSSKLLWAVDLLVFAPARAKHPLVRELRAVAETFRYN